jgi:DNA-binding transcriptional LysR family regulator
MNNLTRRNFVLNLASAGLGVTVLPHIAAAPASKKAEHII